MLNSLQLSAPSSHFLNLLKCWNTKSYFSVLPSCIESLRSICLAVTPQKSETLNQSSNQDHTTTILCGSHKNDTSKVVTVNKLFKGVILILIMYEFYSSLESLLLLFEVILTLILGHFYFSGLINFPVGGHFDSYIFTLDILLL